jgi:hypothetical protein
MVDRIALEALTVIENGHEIDQIFTHGDQDSMPRFFTIGFEAMEGI